MGDNFNTTAGWVLFAGIIALGTTILTGEYFHAEAPGKGGYHVESTGESGGGGGAAEKPIAELMQTADAAKGEEVFKKCTSCHTIAQGGANGTGPNLYGTMGEEIGKGKAGFAFSGALSGHGGKWDFEAMNAWLSSPKKFADGTKMSFAGLSKGEDRANLIAYINSMGSNLPMPAAPKADAAAAPAADAKAAPAATK